MPRRPDYWVCTVEAMPVDLEVDFVAVDVVSVDDEHATVNIDFHMSLDAEHAAAMQTMGFFEALLELAGATGIQASFESRRWSGDDRTVLSLNWTPA